ncbi:MAG: hypothetical protein ACP5EP_05930 [Acidobacteriaceae bacterium]
MTVNINLNDAQIRGLISAAVQREHAAAATISMASHGEVYRQIKPTDKPTPAAAKYKTMETLWGPVLQEIYATPAGKQLGSVLRDPRIGTTRIEVPPKKTGGS